MSEKREESVLDWTKDRRLQRFGMEVYQRLGASSANDWTRNLVQYAPQNPKLLECDAATVAAALSKGESLGLRLGVTYYVIPRYSKRAQRMEATFQLGYRGAITIATRGGRATHMRAYVVTARELEADRFYIAHHESPPFYHRPLLDRTNSDEVALVFAVAMVDGAWHIDWMSRDEVNDHAAKYGGDVWKGATHSEWAELAKKTIIIRLSKQLPVPDEAHAAFALDGQVLDVTGNAIIREDAKPQAQVSSGIRAALEAQQQGDVIDVEHGSDSRESVSAQADPGPGYTEDELPFR